MYVSIYDLERSIGYLDADVQEPPSAFARPSLARPPEQREPREGFLPNHIKLSTFHKMFIFLFSAKSKISEQN